MSNKVVYYMYQTNEIEKIEEKIKELLIKKIEKRARKDICIGLAQIKNKKLYKQIGLNTFKEYLKEKRIPISYSTAIEYSIIGNMLLKYEKELSDIDFDENDGLKKLLRVSKVLTRTNSAPDMVFNMIKKFSLREFEKYLNYNVMNKTKRPLQKMNVNSGSSIQMDEEVIYFAPDEIEIIWFNMDLENKLGIPHVYKELRAVLLSTIKNFFQARFSIN